MNIKIRITVCFLAIVACVVLAAPSVTDEVGAYSGCQIRGKLLDGTPNYSEKHFKHFENVVTKAMAKPEVERNNQALMEALEQLIGPNGPIANATITLHGKLGSSPYYTIPQEVVTDSQGQFVFTNVPMGEYVIAIETNREAALVKPGIQWQVKHERRHDYVNLTYPSDLITVKGKITDTSGLPLKSVKVTAIQDRFNGELQRSPPQYHLVSAESGADGSYELRGLLSPNIWEAGRNITAYKIQATLKDYVTVETKEHFVPEDVRAATERLFRSSLRGNGPEWKDQLAGMMKEISRYPCKGNTITGMDFVLGSSAQISGHVLKSTSKPPLSCHVRLVPVRDAPVPLAKGVQVPKRVPIDNEGNFKFSDVPAGSYNFRVNEKHRGVNIDGTSVTIGHGQVQKDIELKYDLQATGGIKATVCDAMTGKPITNFSAYIYRVVNPKEYYPATGTLRKDSTGPGTFSVAHISPGKAELHMSAPGYAPEKLYVDVPSGATAPLRVRMVRAGAAAVGVTLDGASVMPMLLQAFSVETNSVVYSKRRLNDEGLYLISELKPGRYKVRAQISAGARAVRYETAPIVIEADKTSNTTIDFSGSSELSIALSFPKELRAQVRVEDVDAPPEQPIERNLDMHASTWAQWSGDYKIKHLRLGTYRISARLTDPKKRGAARFESVAEQKQTVTLQKGKTSAIRFSF